MFVFSSTAFLLPLLYTVIAQEPNCTAVGFGDIEATSGIDLTVCKTEDLQCCTAYYVDHILLINVKNELENYLKTGYKNGIIDSLDKLANLTKYLDNFLEDIIYAISAEITLNPMIEAIITQLRDVLTVNSNRYEVCPVINEQLVDIVRIIVTDRFNNEDIPTEQCIDDAIKEKTNMDAIWKLSSSLIKLYANIVPAIEMIQSFLTTQENRIENVSVSSGCVNGFIETSFCRQCTQRTPPLCLATCNALVRGCYSPFYTILNGQFSALWNEVRTVINSTVTLVQYALSNAGKLVDTRAVLLEIESSCKITADEDGRDRDSDMKPEGIPYDVKEALLNINGPFQYGEGDLEMCLVNVDNNSCNTDEPGCIPPETTGCVYTTDPGDITTSNCTCFDGVTNTRNNETQVFYGNDIHDQVDNPAFLTPLNVTELEDMIEMANDPVRVFLNSEEYSSLRLQDDDTDECVSSQDECGEDTSSQDDDTDECGEDKISGTSLIVMMSLNILLLPLLIINIL